MVSKIRPHTPIKFKYCPLGAKKKNKNKNRWSDFLSHFAIFQPPPKQKYHARDNIVLEGRKKKKKEKDRAVDQSNLDYAKGRRESGKKLDNTRLQICIHHYFQK